MRRARKTADGRWHIVEEEGVLCRIGPPHWGPDEEGHWPEVEFSVRSFREPIACPACGTAWVFEQVDCVFGIACKDGNDVVVLVRCAQCRLPHRTRAIGFVTAYPRVTQLMEGWVGWEKRRAVFEAEELRLYGPLDPPSEK